MIPSFKTYVDENYKYFNSKYIIASLGLNCRFWLKHYKNGMIYVILYVNDRRFYFIDYNKMDAKYGCFYKFVKTIYHTPDYKKLIGRHIVNLLYNITHENIAIANDNLYYQIGNVVINYRSAKYSEFIIKMSKICSLLLKRYKKYRSIKSITFIKLWYQKFKYDLVLNNKVGGLIINEYYRLLIYLLAANSNLRIVYLFIDRVITIN